MLTIRDLTKTYGQGPSQVQAVGGISFDVEPGEFLCIVGPSGAGKTTLLRCLIGLLSPTSGGVSLHGTPIDGPPEAMALVFQDYGRSLMPWYSVGGNVELPLRNKVASATERRDRVRSALAEVGLEGFVDHYIWQLSGGMQQRVAIARALAYKPDILLMDEPFGSVDAQTRSDLEDLMLQVHADLGVTTVFVTHDIDESVYLGDRVLVLTKRPSVIADIVEVDLPRPRDQIETKSAPRFTELRTQVMRLIRPDTQAVESPRAADSSGVPSPATARQGGGGEA
ncbi:ABC transporter ATP-binding protein [Egicoccus sp. AB-alg2]|uniref:ABC transporter ATP-binding protein n=1 Tax=Egicoccus sp. AB-alg2 TaxID=3242693 RepID=UPI00359E2A18